MNRRKRQSRQNLYVIKKYIWAMSLPDALKKEKDTVVDDIWIDEDWRRGTMNPPRPREIGYAPK